MAEQRTEQNKSVANRGETARNDERSSLQARSTSESRGSELSRSGREDISSAFARSPFAVMRRMMDDMDRMFEDFGIGSASWPFARAGLGRSSSWLGAQAWSPEIEVQQRGDQLVVRADLPGIKSDDIQIELSDGALWLRGERRQEQEGEREGVRYSERSYGAFTRSIAVPEGTRPEDIDAKFDNGVLEVCLKLPEERRARKVQIKSSSAPSSQSAR